MEIFIATDTASVQLFFNIIATGIETFVTPWDQLLNTCVVEVCHLGLEPLCDNHLCLSVILRTLTLTGQEMKRGLHTLPQKPRSSQCIGVTVDLPVRRNSSRRRRGT
jgi:hypothetical protein